MDSKLRLGFVFIFLFVVVGVLVFTNVTQSLDAQMAVSVNHADPGSLFTYIMVILSKYGREYFWIPVVGVMLLFGNRGTKLLAFELAALFIAGIVVGEVLKLLVYRPRPFVTLDSIILRVPTDTDSSFPSGHALIVSIGAIFSLVKLRHKAVALVFTLEATLVCYSRVYVGAHYPLDVVAGILVGAGIVYLGLFIIEKYLPTLMSKLTTYTIKIVRNGPLEL